MTDTVRIVTCVACGTDIRSWSMCPRCNRKEFNAEDVVIHKIVTEKEIAEYIVATLKRANGYIVSKYSCIACGGEHKMVWPGTRDPLDYSRVSPLTFLPQCPIKVWNYGSKKGFPTTLSDFLEGVKYERDV